VLVATSAQNCQILRSALGPRADLVRFVDVQEVGGNPARLIPMWTEFAADSHAGSPRRGVEEHVWPGRSRAELHACHRHEALVSLALADLSSFQLLCPYDRASLPEDVLERVWATHRFVTEAGERAESSGYLSPGAALASYQEPLTPPDDAFSVAISTGPAVIRRFVASVVSTLGLGRERVSDTILAVHEVVANALTHGTGDGAVRIWTTPDAVLVQIDDGGWIEDPLAGLTRPTSNARDGRGLWLVNHLCDLAEIRSSPNGTTARLLQKLEA
jgi:anti-sigma regulatory factor (Ser/Thr protein kinase)